jgi:hypothetical protein
VRPGNIEEEAILGPAVTVPAEPNGRALPQPLLEGQGERSFLSARNKLHVCGAATGDASTAPRFSLLT